MAEGLFLNKKQVDLFSGKVTRKLQIGDIGDISARKSSYSYTIKLPKTSKNIQVFEMLGVAGNTSRKPFEEISADYVVDSVYLVTNGLAIIKETDDNFNVNIIDGVRSLGELLQNKKISQLPLDDLNHILTTQNYVDSFAHTEGYIYGIANYGQGVSSTVKVEKQAPSIFTHTLFRRIFESNGLSLQGEFFTTNERYLSEVVTPAKGYTVSGIAFTSVAKGGVNSNELSRYDYSTEYLTFSDKFTLTNNSLVGASVILGNIVFSVAGTYKLDVSVGYNIYKTNASVQVKINGVTRSSIYLYDDKTSQSRSIVLTVNVSDEVSIWVSGSAVYDRQDYNDYETDYNDRYYQINYSADVSASLYLQTGGQLIKPSDYIGDMTQLDFIKDVINRYGLLLHPIQATNEFKFKRIEALLSDRATAEDWTDKVVSFDGESYISGYAKTNKALFQYPDQTIIPTNNGEMIIDNVNADNEKTMFTSPFEIPVVSGSISGTSTYLIPIWNTVPENLETPLKVMNVERLSKSITAKLFTEVTGISVTSGVPFLTIEYIDMQYFLNSFYRSFQALIDNYKAVDLTMNLSVIDIYQIDFFRLKYLKQTGRFYYMTGIQNTAGKASKVEAIEILEFPENQPPSQVGTYTFNLDRLSTRTITLGNLSTGYEDTELDDPLKIKIISGFNSNVLIKQGGVTLTAETEINVEDLDLTVEEVLGGVDDYVEQWVFAIADAGSGSYGTKTGKLIANVLEYNNFEPVADAGSNQNIALTPKFVYYPADTYVRLNGSASYDDTGEIVAYSWTLVSVPEDAIPADPEEDPTFELVNANKVQCNLKIRNDEQNVGDYVVRLTVTDEFGLTDTDDVTITVTL